MRAGRDSACSRTFEPWRAAAERPINDARGFLRPHPPWCPRPGLPCSIAMPSELHPAKSGDKASLAELCRLRKEPRLLSGQVATREAKYGVWISWFLLQGSDGNCPPKVLKAVLDACR